MFNAYEFTFAGESSVQYGVMLYDFGKDGQDDVDFGNEASIIETRITHRVQPIHHGVNYHGAPLEFDLVFGAFDPLDRFEIEKIAMWLTGHQDYQWLSIHQEDLEHVQFRCLITKMTPITDGWMPYAFKATVTCDCPYAYSYPFSQAFTVSGTTDASFVNDTSVREYLKPILYYNKSSGVTEFKIKNTTDGNREFTITGLPSAALEITIDCNSGIFAHNAGTVDLYSGFNGNLFRLLPGKNKLQITGDGTLTIAGRTLHNVGA